MLFSPTTTTTVAITGCPNSQPDHAVRMVRFARDCMKKTGQLTADLVDTLGESTRNLGFRVGLHSGSVTAGVLRGQKARFQLFGDSVNTAARIESNGVKGKIHVSEETAKELVAHGKQSWLTQREQPIHVKGKGEMQTYFVDTSTVAASSVAMSTTTSDGGDDDDADDSDDLEV